MHKELFEPSPVTIYYSSLKNYFVT